MLQLLHAAQSESIRLQEAGTFLFTMLLGAAEGCPRNILFLLPTPAVMLAALNPLGILSKCNKRPAAAQLYIC
jgi:hypothetical protein